MKTTAYLSAAILAVSILPAAAQPSAKAAPYLRFSDFEKSLVSARADSYVGRSGAKVADARAFEDMRRHLLNLYGHVTVSHSFDRFGQVFDCVPLMQQPGIRLGGVKKVAAPPPMRPGKGPGMRQLPPGSRDAFGSLQHCERGTIPMRRLTLNELTRFRTLHDFFQKGPGGEPLLTKPPHDPNGHSYSVASQGVDNWGGYGYLNLWRPKVNTTKGETFSLSQHWYVGGSPVQTAETGWQNFPGKYGTEDSVLFIYYTADGYQNTGCYNLDCSAFVQTDGDIYIGGTFSNYSTRHGDQYEIAIGYYLYQGNWWLNVANNWVGYYPGSLYNGGQLAYNATEIEFGGEVCCTGATRWAPMGSGSPANKGWQIAAYHRHLLYVDTDYNGYNPSLSTYTPSPKCYTMNGPYYDDSTDWWTYFFFGGKGGRDAKC